MQTPNAEANKNFDPFTPTATCFAVKVAAISSAGQILSNTQFQADFFEQPQGRTRAQYRFEFLDNTLANAGKTELIYR